MTTYSCDLDVARCISKAFPFLSVDIYENFSEYAYGWMKGMFKEMSRDEIVQYCDVEGRAFLIDIWEELLNKSDIVIEDNEIVCHNKEIFTCMIEIYAWLDL